MRAVWMVTLAAVAAAVPIGGGTAQAADREPYIVVPGRPGVPVMRFGRDISWTIIEGDWGLERPGHGEVAIIPTGPTAIYGPSGGGYYPATGRAPRYGRDEREPPANRQLPPPAESYFRAWGAQSDPTPATSPPAVESPPIIVAPQINPQQPYPPRPQPRPPRRP